MRCEMSNGILVCNCDKGFVFRSEFNSSGYQICDGLISFILLFNSTE